VQFAGSEKAAVIGPQKSFLPEPLALGLVLAVLTLLGLAMTLAGTVSHRVSW